MTDMEHLLGKFQSTNLEGRLKTSKYYKWIADVQARIHRRIPDNHYNTSRVPRATDYREEIFEGKNCGRAVIYLLSNGCEWSLKGASGCTMCGHLARQTRQESMLSPDDHVFQFQTEFARVDSKQYPLLNVFNNGSFLNDNEIAPAARRRILQQINADPHIRMVVLESRPEFVSEDKIAEIRELVPDKHVEIALGLELKNDLYRSTCLNKGFSLKQYDTAADLVCGALHLRTYVFLKPPFLIEQESIDEAVDTVEHAFRRGSTTVSLEACTIQDYTLVRCLYDTGQFKPPWLWSILEVVKRCFRPDRKLVVGMFRFFPSPEVVPFNCDQCSRAVMQALAHYNRTLDIAAFDSLSCACRRQWQTQLTEPAPPLAERIEIALSRLEPHLRFLEPRK